MNISQLAQAHIDYPELWAGVKHLKAILDADTAWEKASESNDVDKIMSSFKAYRNAIAAARKEFP